jgi:hypothetical protein
LDSPWAERQELFSRTTLTASSWLADNALVGSDPMDN